MTEKSGKEKTMNSPGSALIRKIEFRVAAGKESGGFTRVNANEGTQQVFNTADCEGPSSSWVTGKKAHQ